MSDILVMVGRCLTYYKCIVLYRMVTVGRCVYKCFELYRMGDV